MSPLTFVAGALVLALLTGCVTLTPQQSEALKEAQRFTDEVTAAYGVSRVQVIVDDRWSRHYSREEWITIEPRFLAGANERAVLAVLLGHHTLGLRGPGPKDLLAANRRGVEIMVRFLGTTEREAVDRVAKFFVAENDYRLERGRRAGVPTWMVGWPMRAWQPCEQLRQLWSSYARADAPPPCDPSPGWPRP